MVTNIRRRFRWLTFGFLGLTATTLLFFGPARQCGGYPDWRTSPYILPYPSGTAYRVYQGNCSFGGHQRVYRYSYDFLMPIGTLVTAARAGTVADVLDGYPDGGSSENYVAIQHADGNFTFYSHLHQSLVAMGDEVQAGDPIGLSGSSGRTGGVPHLHFQLSPCLRPLLCDTMPITFHNTDPNPFGLQADYEYPAR